MVFAGFNVLASKVLAALVGLAMLATLFWARNWLARVITILAIGTLALLWVYQDARYLRFFILFLGYLRLIRVMSSLYSLWDIIEDLIVRKVNESDASAFARICCGGLFGAQFWFF